MLNRLKTLALSAFAFFLCGFFAYDYYRHRRMENNEKVVTGESTGSRMESRRRVETYTINYRYSVEGQDYTGSDNVPKAFYQDYDLFNRPIKVGYEASNPSNSEIAEPALPENHNDINWGHGIFILGSGFTGLYLLRDGARGASAKIWIGIEYLGRRITPLYSSLTKKRAKREFRDLRELKILLDDGCITEREYAAKKKELLNRV